MTTVRSSKRQELLEIAADRASVDGLEGLTIGSLASAAGMSKSGVAGLFGNKADLQVATVRAAAARFEREVVGAVDVEAGVARLRALVRQWIEHIGDAYSGGCVFIAAATDVDGHPGPARNALAEIERSWIGTLAAEAKLAVRLGELPASTDPDQLAFELFGLLMAANFWNQLFDDAGGLDRARIAVDRLLHADDPS